MAMTVEELEIIIQAKVDKVVPQIRKMMADVKKELQDSNIDFSSISNSINKEVAKTKPVIKKLKDEFNEELDPKIIKIIDEMKPKIKGISNEYSKLTKKIQETNAISKKLETPTTNKQEYAPYITAGQRLQQMENPAQDVSPSSKSFSLWDSLRGKISLIKPAIQEIKADWNSTDGLLGQVRIKCSGILGTVKKTIGNIATGVIKAGKLASKLLGIRKTADSLKSAVSGGVKTLIKYAGALIGIRSIYNGLKSLASEWLNSNDSSAKQLKANLDYMKMAIGQSLAPVVEYIINLIYKALSAVQNLIFALTKVNIFSKATASNYKKMASSASSASKETKQLAGIHSDINNIADNNSGGGGGGTSPSLDLSNVNKELSPLEQKLYNFFKPLKDSWDTYGASLIEQIKKTVTQVIGLISSVWGSFEKVITNGTIYNSLELILAIIGNIAEAFANAWNYNGNGDIIIQNLVNAFNNLLTAINNVVSSTEFQEWLNKVSDKFKDISDKLASIDWQPLIDFVFNVGSAIGDVALNILNGLVDVFKFFVEHPTLGAILVGVAVGISAVISAIKTIVEIQKILSLFGLSIVDLIAKIGGLIATALPVIAIVALVVAAIAVVIIVIKKVSEQIEIIKENWPEAWEYIKTKINEKVTELKEKVIQKFTEIKDKATEKITNMKENAISKFNELREKAIEKVTNLKTKALDTFENLKSSISNKITNIKTTIVNGFENAVNYIKSLPSQALNWGKDLIGNIVNGIKSKIGDVRNAITEVANNIKAYLHFSEPDVGPLSDFHTYMPDMISLMKEGIERNMGTLISSVEKMAEEMSLTLNTGVLPEYSVNGITGRNSLQSFGFKDVVGELSSISSNNNSSGIDRLVVKIGDKTIFDEAIDFINEKSKRLGKNVIEVR